MSGKSDVYRGLENTGAAVILPSSNHPVVDDYLKYQQQERVNSLKKNKPFELPSDYSGVQGLMGRVFDPDIVPLSQKLEGIKQKDAILKAQRMNGQISDTDYIKGKQEIDHVKYGELMPQLIQSVRDREFFDRNYPQWRNAPEKHSSETGDYLMGYDQLPIGQRQKPELMKQLSEVDFSSILQGGVVPEVRTVKKINPDGSTTETVRTEVSPVELRTSAELAAKDKTVKGQALRKTFEAEVPNGSEDDYVKWIEKQKLAKNKWTIRSAYKEGRAPQGSSGSSVSSGNGFTDGKNRWEYSVTPKGDEIITFSHTDASDNKPLVLVNDKGQAETATPIYFNKKKSGNPTLIAKVKNEYGEEVEKEFQYTPYNAAKIKNEFGYDPYEARLKITGSTAPKPPSGKQSYTKEQLTKEAISKNLTSDDDEIINNTLDFENKKGYSNYGFTSYNGKLNKQQALEKAKKEYLPMVAGLPTPLKAVAFDFAFNSEDPRASLVVASGVFSPEDKKQLYKNGKLDKELVDYLWNKQGGKDRVLQEYNKNPNKFLDAFDKERKRSYDNTNGADEKGNEWYERVDASRSLANKILSSRKSAAKQSKVSFATISRVVKKFVNKQLGKTKLIYSDGTEEIIDGI